MAPQDELDIKAEEWINSILLKLQYKQDYTICFGHSKELLNDDGTQKGIAIRRPYIRLFPTGITKLYKVAVMDEKLPDVEYSAEEEAKLDEFIAQQEEAHESETSKG